ncbi:hypothetical protein IAG44_24450 [Streptomyces roseirectus]|uniref:Lipoprotein n=1 Tax=Streptomyces roseirectus TaxID=2768066 RepID=A0A7H0IHI8_9ACTN|nr:DUF6174 domain-containing protein [Streptomyces roseirectus]QNP72254.1 hypothetical protein IAG44_24450 [Streptomyces roseirectus]
MPAVRLLPPATLLLLLTTACASAPARTGPDTTPWREPSSYAYTLVSDTQVLAGTFRITVRDARVTAATGLDDKRLLPQLPTIGDLLTRLREARERDADTADIEYAPDGRPTRLVLDDSKNAVDDEATYTITAYTAAPA